MELQLKLVTTSPGGWVVGGWTKTKLMLFSTQVEDLVGVRVELGNSIGHDHYVVADRRSDWSSTNRANKQWPEVAGNGNFRDNFIFFFSIIK